MFKTDSCARHTKTLNGYRFCSKLHGNRGYSNIFCWNASEKESHISLQYRFNFITCKHEAFHVVAEDSWAIRFNCNFQLLRDMNTLVSETSLSLAQHMQASQHSTLEAVIIHSSTILAYSTSLYQRFWFWVWKDKIIYFKKQLSKRKSRPQCLQCRIMSKLGEDEDSWASARDQPPWSYLHYSACGTAHRLSPAACHKSSQSEQQHGGKTLHAPAAEILSPHLYCWQEWLGRRMLAPVLHLATERHTRK